MDFSKEAEMVFDSLKNNSTRSKKARMIYGAVCRSIELIKNDTHHGCPIAKNKVPQKYVKLYDANNLFRVELPCYWRLLYTMTNNKIEIVAFMVDIISHIEYNKIFGYKKR